MNITDNKNNKKYFEFLKSAMCLSNMYMETSEVIDWLKKQNNKVDVNVDKIEFSQLKQWAVDKKNASLRHTSGGFFSIDGINIKTNWGAIHEWEQPIINQPEIGYLGFITKEINGVLHFLMQAKIEPGNVNYVQLSPTLQATRSNYRQLHKGKKPLYIEYFQKASADQILLDQLQSEQGARFLKKRNRNIIIKLDEDIPVYDNFTWLTLAQLKLLMQHDNLVNMDSRTVISGITFGVFSSDIIDIFDFLKNDKMLPNLKSAFLKSSLTANNSHHTLEEIITFLTHLKSSYDLLVTQKNMHELSNWTVTESEIHHNNHKYFKIIAVDVQIGNREVVSWSQPMVQPAQDGLCAFICKEIKGVLHFIVQAKLECGNHDVIEFAPTVQTLTGDYREAKKNTLPFLDYALNAPERQVYFDTLQSEEGGRFFREQNRNMIIIAGEEIADELPENYIWMTLNQLQTFLQFNNYLNIQTRSLIAAISFV